MAHARIHSLPLPQSRAPLLTRLFRLMALGRSRRHLQALEPHMLEDIGLSRDAAVAEAARPVWDAPAHWKL